VLGSSRTPFITRRTEWLITRKWVPEDVVELWAGVEDGRSGIEGRLVRLCSSAVAETGIPVVNVCGRCIY
jgi:hypothetical protein